MNLGSGEELAEARPFLTGAASYVGDRAFDGLHAVFVRSFLAHGHIRDIDTAAASEMAGVVAVETASSIGLQPFVHFDALRDQHARYPLASGTVRHVGEAVAVVLAKSRAQAVDAAELVAVDIDPLAPVLRPGAEEPRVYDASRGNEVYRQWDGSDEDPTADACVVVEAHVANPKVASAPLETDGIVVRPTSEGGLDVWCTSQGVHEFRDSLAGALGVERERVRVRAPAVGGAFGGRATLPVEFVVVAQLALRHGRPVRWVQDRTENLTGMPQGRGVESFIRLGLDGDGAFVGLDVSATADAGATAHMAGLLLVSIERQAVGLYRIPRLRWRGRAMLTNTTPVGAYRGAGQPEANHARERVIDIAARRLGVDPIELRRRNLLRADELPRHQPGGVLYDEADPAAALDTAIGLADVEGWRSAQRDRRATTAAGPKRQIGIGVASYAQTSGRGSPPDAALVRIDEGGRVTIACGSPSHGQSHATTWRRLVTARLGIASSLIDVIDADTDTIAQGLTTGGSRASQVLASVIASTCDDIVDAARDLAASLLEVAPADLVVAPEGYGQGAGLAVAGVPTRRVTWARAAAEGTNRCLEAARHEPTGGEAHPFGAHVSIVEVDPETGSVALVAHTAVDDCGVVLEPAVVEGQQHGGSVAGLAQALFEHVSHDEAGNPEAATFMSYLLPAAADVCPVHAHTMSTPTSRNALGTRGIGENGCNGATAAVHNAVIDALTPFGVEHIDLPLTPERVWRAIQAASSAAIS